jgi:divalent metal cation (Fe/Co/Zn/Cd) transporter
LRTAFVSSGNQQGSWIYRFTHGRPAHFDAAMEELKAAKLWVLLCGVVITEAAVGVLWLVTPAGLFNMQGTAAQMLVGAGMCVVLTDALFANVMIVPFTGEPSREKSNLAFTLLLYFTFFPAVTAVAVISDQWIEQGWQNFGLAAIAIVVIHLWFRYRHREQVRINSAQAELEEGEEDFPMRLGLRY